MKNIFILFALVVLVSCSKDDTTSGTRYIDEVFTNTETNFDIVYGANAGLVGISGELYLDVYQPSGDNLERRPAIVMAHGGAFVSGTKSQISEICKSYARKGYVVASIGYRLINDPTITQKDSVGFTLAFTEAVIMALHDMKAAVRFLRNDALNANTYGIDPDIMFAGGVSAGAVMANHIGSWDENEAIPDYMQDILDDNGGFEGNTNNIEQSSKVSGIISFSGSIFDENWIDAGDPPTFFVHEEFDPVVPCGYQGSSLFPYLVFAYGACELSQKADELGIENEFILLEGKTTHVGYLGEDDENSQSYIDASAAFLAKIIAD